MVLIKFAKKNLRLNKHSKKSLSKEIFFKNKSSFQFSVHKKIEEFLAARGAMQTCNVRTVTTNSQSPKGRLNQRHGTTLI